jgi:hypothetical protein
MHALQSSLRGVARVAAASATRLHAPAARVHTRWTPLLQGASAAAAAQPAAKVADSAAAPVVNKHPRIVSTASVIGEHVSHGLDLSQASIGQQIDLPYETTIHESQQVLWMSTFQIHDRLYTSSPFAQLLHLPQHVLPFYMILFKV